MREHEYAGRHGGRPLQKICLLAVMVGWCGVPSSWAQPPRLLDDFESVAAWSARPSEDVALELVSEQGHQGRALAMRFDFRGHGGYAVARRALPLDLPENYELTLWLRGEARANNLEIKLVDDSGDNVWWYHRRDFEFPAEWTPLRIRKRQISFAWGPLGGGELRRAAALEIAITAGQGGSGTVWLDQLALTALPPVNPHPPAPTASAACQGRAESAGEILDGDASTVWHCASESAPLTVELDLQGTRELGGAILDWAGDDFATDYRLEASSDGRHWETLRAVAGGNGGRDYLATPDAEAAHLRLAIERTSRQRGVRLAELRLQPLSFGASPNDLLHAVAADVPRGTYPRAFVGEQVYWTVVGADGAKEEGLLSEDGAFEVAKGGFSIEPFVRLGAPGRETLVSWASVRTEPSLEDGDLPIPSVTWRHPELELTVTAVAVERSPSAFALRYRLRNLATEPRPLRLFAAVRPLQVQPPQQFLNTPGGFAPISTIRSEPSALRVDERRCVVALRADRAGASTFDAGEVVGFLAHGDAPPRLAVTDAQRLASGALGRELMLAPGEETSWELQVFEVSPPGSGSCASVARSLPSFEDLLRTTRDAWRERLSRVSIRLPSGAVELERALRSSLAYILVNRDGPAIQPGSRSYERSWIRDGALTSAALLALGHEDEVESFIRWFTPFQFENGKVPCCVDARGADPVTENDSHGELLFLIAEHYRITRQAGLARELWPNIVRAVAHLEGLRASRRTPEYASGPKRLFFGLLPESISHEGYSAKPMHSYWDDFFAIRGLKDAVFLAEALGHDVEARAWETSRDELIADVQASIRVAIEHHGIDFIPGAAELGDFDATSTTVALSPGGEGARLPQDALHRTFERAHASVLARRHSVAWDAYTPYEWRLVGSLLRLGWRDRAWDLIDDYLADRRPLAWNQWPEVVWRQERVPKFLGDLPHTWVASDFIRSTLDLFAYEREDDDALVVLAGIPERWLVAGESLAIKGLRTRHGALALALETSASGTVRIRIGSLSRPPAGGVVLVWPGDRSPRAVRVNGVTLDETPERELVLVSLPAQIELDR